MRPGYIAFEGIDGSGKTTQARRLAAALAARGTPVLSLGEPSGSAIGGLIRRTLAGEIALDEPALALLFAADRLDQQQAVILPRLAAGDWVISDRSFLSSLAYQALSELLTLEWLRTINRPVRPPDLTLYLALVPETAAGRLRQRPGVDERYDELGQQQAVARHFQQAVAYLRAEGQCIVEINAAAEPDAVASAIWTAVEQRFSLAAAGR